MTAALLVAAALAADPFPYAAAEAELSEAITPAELKAHVYRLASPEFRKQFDGIPVGRAVKVKGECGGKFENEVFLNRGWLVP